MPNTLHLQKDATMSTMDDMIQQREIVERACSNLSAEGALIEDKPVRIKILQSQERAAAAELFSATYPDRGREAQEWHGDDGRWVAITPDSVEVVGYAALRHSHAQKYRMDLIVQPQWQQQGIGGQLLDIVVRHAQACGARTVQARARSTDPRALPFLQKRGFHETIRLVTLALEVDTLDLDSYAHLEGAWVSRGMTITTLASEQASNPRCWQGLADVHKAAGEDWPDPDPGSRTNMTADEMQQQVMRLNTMPEAFFIAKHGQRPIGFSGLASSTEHVGVARSSGTAVHPAWRSMGIATALKVRCLAFARDHGFVRLTTATAHPAMLRINEKLGFQPGFTETRLVRDLHARSEGLEPQG